MKQFMLFFHIKMPPKMFWGHKKLIAFSTISWHKDKDHFVYVPSQWEMRLQCNIASWRYNVTSPLIGFAHTQNDLWKMVQVVKLHLHGRPILFIVQWMLLLLMTWLLAGSTSSSAALVLTNFSGNNPPWAPKCLKPLPELIMIKFCYAIWHKYVWLK